MRNKLYDAEGREIGEHYFLAGAHLYEFKRGLGRPRAGVAVRETPTGDGEILWQKHDGDKYLRNLQG